MLSVEDEGGREQLNAVLGEAVRAGAVLVGGPKSGGAVAAGHLQVTDALDRIGCMEGTARFLARTSTGHAGLASLPACFPAWHFRPLFPSTTGEGMVPKLQDATMKEWPAAALPFRREIITIPSATYIASTSKA